MDIGLELIVDMSKEPTEVTLGDITFELRPYERHPSSPERICLRKKWSYTERYLALAEEFRGCRMVEVGVDQGGSTSFFLKLLDPQGLLALELSDNPVARVMNFLEVHDPKKRVKICWGVDQADRVKVPRLVDEMFASQPLDLVVDDASHLLAQTTTTFELLFPRLRSGGLFIIEDWSKGHNLERRMTQEIIANPEGELAQKLEAARVDPGLQREMPISRLICQLLIAAARNPGWITEVRAIDNFCEIRRGDAEIEPGTPISTYIGEFGRWMFEHPDYRA